MGVRHDTIYLELPNLSILYSGMKVDRGLFNVTFDGTFVGQGDVS